jgi:hypothetical protein
MRELRVSVRRPRLRIKPDRIISIGGTNHRGEKSADEIIVHFDKVTLPCFLLHYARRLIRR